MEKKDFFISYNKSNKDWAKWIGGILEENGYSVYLQAWDIAPGDDFIERMNDFLHDSENYLAVLSSAFWESEYCRKEFQTAFNAHLKGSIKKFLPVRVEDFPPDPLYETIVYIDLFPIHEENEAKRVIINGIENVKNPRKKGIFPNSKFNDVGRAAEKERIDYPLFPGGTDKDLSVSKNGEVRDIILLESDQNKRGDLFNRLVYDVLHSLGFGDALFDVQQTGREIDMVLRHRTENRYALVESKAQKEKIGGADVNKFVGAIDVARGAFERSGASVTGYFISRSGFTATALEQEHERELVRKRRREQSELILLGPSEIVHELIGGNMLCPLSRASGAVMLPKDTTLSLCRGADLIASDYGWIWALYYSTHPLQCATHFALVHADGKQLLNHIAESLLAQAAKADDPFAGLTYLPVTPDTSLNKQAAKEIYFRYLENELGDIQFEGMPTDKEAGAVKVNLESIFVPLSFNYENTAQQPKGTKRVRRASKRQSTSIQEVLTQTSRAAILAKPGGGKSTLIRRIALAYAYPERRKKVDDGLPDRDWFPVYIRCRDLGDNATKSISEIIGTIIYRAEITSHSSAFNSLIEDNLQEGRILLLIDGLDEISLEKNRICFVNQLRTFVATYPSIHLIVTSRETGFRAVAGALASYCQQYSIANLDEKKIRYLSLKWHQAILGESDQTQQDSEKVCDIIIGDPRIVALAENPLLLTTLLFVKRWVGYLPTKKCRLYEEMIKLLLVTWNAAAHDRLDLDETEPQLAFVAYSMTIQGQQKITRSQLKQYIIQARHALPELLTYTQVSPSKFIDQVEDRSSLLIQLGLEENESGQLEPSYEFSHLSFQEYLTARAIVQSWVPNPESCTLLSIVEQNMSEVQWAEVIPLAAVLSGRRANSTIEYLINICKGDPHPSNSVSPEQRGNTAALLLGNCVASEVPMGPEQLEQALTQVIQRKYRLDSLQMQYNGIAQSHMKVSNMFSTILKSKYGTIYRQFIQSALFEHPDPIYMSEFSDAWINICLEEDRPSLSSIAHMLSTDCDRQQKVTAVLLMMEFAFENLHTKYLHRAKAESASDLHSIFSSLLGCLHSSDDLTCFSSAWCIAWSGYNEADIIPTDLAPDIADRLVELWVNRDAPHYLKRALSWAVFSICCSSLHIQEIPGLGDAIEINLTDPKNSFDQLAAVHLAVVTGRWTKERFLDWVNGDESRLDAFNVRGFRYLREINYIQQG